MRAYPLSLSTTTGRQVGLGGCVARNCRARNWAGGFSPSSFHCRSKEGGNQDHPLSHFALFHALHLPFAEHVHDLESQYRFAELSPTRRSPSQALLTL